MTRKTKLYIEQKQINWKAVSETLFGLLVFLCCLLAIYISAMSEMTIAVIVVSFFAGVTFITLIACIFTEKFTKTVKVYVKKESDVA